MHNIQMMASTFFSWVSNSVSFKLLKIEFSHLVMATHFLESMIMELGDEMKKALCWSAPGGNLGLCLFWHILHFIVGIWYFALGIADAIESYLISSGWLKRYKALDIGKVRYLAVVVDSKEARQTSKVVELLQWLVAIGVKNVCLYDTEGVLKKSKELIMERISDAKLSKGTTENDPLLDKNLLALEFISVSDGKEAVARAASFLFAKYYMGEDNKEHNFTESHMAEALRAVGCGGPEPDLLLIYAPARCHLGFPAWRIRYTEMVHMGPLKHMKYGSLIKAIYRFTMVRQNYGT